MGDIVDLADLTDLFGETVDIMAGITVGAVAVMGVQSRVGALTGTGASETVAAVKRGVGVTESEIIETMIGLEMIEIGIATEIGDQTVVVITVWQQRRVMSARTVVVA